MMTKAGTELLVRTGKVVMFPVVRKDKLHLDKDGVGFPLEPLIKDIFEPYLNLTINVTIERENGKVKRLTIEEVS